MVRKKVRTQRNLTFQKKKKITWYKAKKVRTRFLLFKRNYMVRKKVRTQILLFKKNDLVRRKVRTQILLLKKSHGKAKGKNSIHTFEMKK